MNDESWDDYNSPIYCEHWEEAFECYKRCKECNHYCKEHHWDEKIRPCDKCECKDFI